MTLSGAMAQLRPDIDALAKAPIVVVIHDVPQAGASGSRRSGAPATTAGLIERDSGQYTADANRLSVAERRASGLRRNGRPRRRI